MPLAISQMGQFVDPFADMIEPGLALIIGPGQAQVGSGVEVFPPSGTAPSRHDDGLRGAIRAGIYLRLITSSR